MIQQEMRQPTPTKLIVVAVPTTTPSSLNPIPADAAGITPVSPEPSPTMSMTETKEMTGMYAHKFSSSDVSTSNNTIRWPDHELRAGDAVLYVPPSGDTQIGGLQRFKVYYVKSAPDSNNLTLCETTNGNYSGNATINFSSAGTSNFGRHQLILCYEMGRTYKASSSYVNYAYTRYYQTNQGSGWDLQDRGYFQGSGNNKYGYWGLCGGEPDRTIYLKR